ncbi:tyrosine-type recombinase/integrase [Corynebacterium doosanense]|uniref:Integrase n=1 Tax=Corynebacterium doosanense CAU 212 = DSM 45436 TaxID=558173 RepID=A0A097IGG6_9CORY|nr:tyrosine-type recombinase/integrase [Corynebacterium doosanense]AIT61243.1 integrase [Corynebacterium doosanense CAU 212 = DSM 45436]
MAREAWGIIDRLPSGRYRARYTHDGARHKAPDTFETKTQAREYLAGERSAIAAGTWIHPDEREKAGKQAQQARDRAQITFGVYATRWITTRTNGRGHPIKASTRGEYLRLVETGRLASWSETPLAEVTAAAVRDWYAEQIATGKLTAVARAYDLMKSILKTAVEDELIETNPCRVRGGSTASTGKKVTPPADDELDQIIEALPEKYRSVAVLAAAGGLRFGEIIALTRDDITIELTNDGDVDAVRIAVARSIAHTKRSGRVEGTTKSEAGERVAAIFGADAVTIAAHVERVPPGKRLWHAARDQNQPLPYHTFEHNWKKAAASVGSTANFHSLRHYSGTRYAQTGATLKETMARLGHSSPVAAMRYQHAGTRDDELARRAAR